VIHLAATLFFTAALLAAAVTAHLTVKLYWGEILLALRGELGLRATAPKAQPCAVPPRRRAAA
jgi:hypothetical protein